MSYKTILNTSKHNQIILLKTIFQQNQIDHRFLDESINTNFPLGVRVQVEERDLGRAKILLWENGFLQKPTSEDSSVSMVRFWLWLVIAFFTIVIISVIIHNWRI